MMQPALLLTLASSLALSSASAIGARQEYDGRHAPPWAYWGRPTPSSSTPLSVTGSLTLVAATGASSTYISSILPLGTAAQTDVNVDPTDASTTSSTTSSSGSISTTASLEIASQTGVNVDVDPTDATTSFSTTSSSGSVSTTASLEVPAQADVDVDPVDASTSLSTTSSTSVTTPSPRVVLTTIGTLLAYESELNSYIVSTLTLSDPIAATLADTDLNESFTKRAEPSKTCTETESFATPSRSGLRFRSSTVVPASLATLTAVDHAFNRPAATVGAPSARV